MGEARQRQYSRQQFLKDHPVCCYCGAPATTTDHCPPRALFIGRVWPEGYEFPACYPCNQEARRDEQAFAVLASLWFAKPQTPAETAHWQKQAKGLSNNQPEIIAELLARTRNQQRRAFRKQFGERGDELRHQGYGMAEIGPKTQAVIRRFSTKLAKALFYKHAEQVLDGEIWAWHFSAANRGDALPVIRQMVTIAPMGSVTGRAGQSLSDQFTYRFNCDGGETPILYAVVQFSDQFMFNITAAGHTFREAVGGSLGALDELPLRAHHVNARLYRSPDA